MMRRAWIDVDGQRVCLLSKSERAWWDLGVEDVYLLERQKHWEEEQMMLRARKAGASYASIARAVYSSPSWVRTAVRRAEREKLSPPIAEEFIPVPDPRVSWQFLQLAYQSEGCIGNLKVD